MSQKDAAAKLGVSQALLSHYEKGIRECGQSFLIKVADFYGVTCDYLLGRTATKNYRGGLDDIAEANKNDEMPSVSTFIKAALTISDYMNKNHTVGGVKLNMILAIELYKLIVEQAAAGNLPKNWAGRAYCDGTVCCTPIYKAIIENSAEAVRTPVKSKNPCLTSRFRLLSKHLYPLHRISLSTTAQATLRQYLQDFSNNPNYTKSRRFPDGF